MLIKNKVVHFFQIAIYDFHRENFRDYYNIFFTYNKIKDDLF